ncbi:hypothetical protein IVB27_32465 [Bradyrhizobium sp. 197]|uniref:hypothetical protein n=1 Tax=Bradyrhizobium sp. 197 TaxID=2782663 RepID=UPI001FF86036|nr:hypothetical protein [Bradyrhizobium sp. 197]MCK1479329.1 hypothetical protein [Bradyrhizobium sp. 197]
MAKLPDDTALGGSPSASSGRPIATYDVTGYARGAAAIGAGASDIGKGVQSASKDIAFVQAQENSQTDALDEARANSNYLIKTKTLRDEISTATDPADLEKTYAPKFQAAYDESVGMISNPRKRELWSLKTAPDLTGQNLAVGDKVYDLQKTQTIASTNDQLDQIRQAALKTQDPEERGKFISAGHQLLGGLKDAGYIDAVTEQKYRKKWTEDYAVSAIQMMPPEDRVKTLSPVVQGKDAVLDRIGQVENATGNPAARSSTSSAMGNFQFTRGTWLDMVQNHRPDLLQGRSEKEILDLRADPKVSREMAGYLLDDNAAVLRNQGISPTPTNLYLAHFLGVNDAAKVLRAPPGTPISDVVTPASIVANKSVLEGKTTDTVVDWSGRKMAGSQRGKGGLVDFIPEDKAYDMLHTARQEVEGGSIEQQRQIKLQAEQVKAQSEVRENEVLQDLYSPQPKMSVQSIAVDPHLTPAAKERMISAAGRALGDTKADKTYGKGFFDAYQKVHAPEGMPGKITDPSELYSRVGPDGDLTVAGVDKLVSEINSRKTPEGVAEGEMKKQFLKNAKSEISGADEGLHIPDPKGENLYLRWLAQALPAYEEGKKAGKTPVQLLNPDSPDYIGKSISGFRRPMSEWFNDVVRDQPAAAQAPTFDATKVQTLNELVAAYRGGKVSKTVADQLAIDKGWAAPRPATLAVPVSQ